MKKWLILIIISIFFYSIPIVYAQETETPTPNPPTNTPAPTATNVPPTNTPTRTPTPSPTKTPTPTPTKTPTPAAATATTVPVPTATTVPASSSGSSSSSSSNSPTGTPAPAAAAAAAALEPTSDKPTPTGEPEVLGATDEANLENQNGQYKIIVTVLNQNNKPFKNVKISLSSDPTEPAIEKKTDKEGKAQFEKVVEGIYIVSAEFQKQKKEEEITASGDKKELEIKFKLNEPANYLGLLLILIFAGGGAGIMYYLHKTGKVDFSSVLKLDLIRSKFYRK